MKTKKPIKKTPKKVAPKKTVKKPATKKIMKKPVSTKSIPVQKTVTPKAKRTEEIKDTVISIRISSKTLERIKAKAQKKDIPYQTMIGKWISKKAK